MNRLYIIILSLVCLVSCSREEPAPIPPGPPKVFRADCEGWIGWDIRTSGKTQRGMKSRTVKGDAHEGEVFMLIENGESKKRDSYITLSYAFEGLTPEGKYTVRIWVQSDGKTDPELFITTDPIWDERTYCRFPNKEWVEWTATHKASKDGILWLRLVMENKGSVKLDDVTITEAR